MRLIFLICAIYGFYRIAKSIQHGLNTIMRDEGEQADMPVKHRRYHDRQL